MIGFKNLNSGNSNLKIKKNIQFVLNEEALEKFKKRRPWEIGKIRNKKHPKIRKI